ncbi:MAG: hypothetical protein AAF612_00815 [Planctomycetota bacterium]
MAKRGWIIVAATAFAAALLAATLFFGGERASLGVDRPAVDPSDPTLDPNALQNRQMADRIGAIDRGVWTSEEGTGPDAQRTFVTWARAQPERNGRSRVTEPEATVFFGRQRAVKITAQRGFFVAPDNKLRNGLFEGDVTVTYIEVDQAVRLENPRAALDLGSDRDVVVRCFLGAPTSFDVEFGEVRCSDGEVQVTGPDAEFLGRGLVLKFNNVRERIEELRITEGRELRFQAASFDDEPPPAQAGDDAAGEPSATPGAAPNRSAEAPTPRVAASDAPNTDGTTGPARQAQYYTCQFSAAQRNSAQPDAHVVVEHSAEGGLLTGQELALTFSLGAAGDSQSLTDAHKTPPRAAHIPPAPASQHQLVQAVYQPAQAPGYGLQRTSDTVDLPSAGAPATSRGIPEPLRARRSLFQRSDRDVVVTWSGPMVLKPHDGRPRELAGPDDAKLVLRGAPARAQLGEAEAQGAEVSYLRSRGEAVVKSGPGAAAQLESPEMGRVTGREMRLDTSRRSAVVLGPGRLAETSLDTDPSAPPGPQRGLRLAWRDRLNLSFYPGDDVDPDGDPNPGQLGGPRLAEFEGEVRVDHPELDLQAEALALHFADGPDAGESVRRIDASGQVNATLRSGEGFGPLQGVAVDGQPASTSEEPRQDIGVAGRSLRVDLEPDGVGGVGPHRVEALGDVTLTQGEDSLQAQEVRMQFEPRPADAPQDPPSTQPANTQPQAAPATAPATQPVTGGDNTAAADGPQADPPEAPEYVVVGFTARRDVVVRQADPPTEVRAEILIAEPDDGRLSLQGRPGAPASLLRNNAILEGELLVLDDQAQSAEVEGPGAFTARADPQEPDARIQIRWTRSMALDGVAGRARFFGQVDASTVAPDEQTRVTADELDVLFDPEALEETETLADEPGEQSGEDSAGALAVRKATARGDARFQSRTVDPDQGGLLLTRLRMESSTLVFENQPHDPDRQRVFAPDAGTLLIEDYRTDEDPAGSPADPEADAADPAPAAPAGPSGPGDRTDRQPDRVGAGAVSGPPEPAPKPNPDARAEPEPQPTPPTETAKPDGEEDDNTLGLADGSGRGQTLFVWDQRMELDAWGNDAVFEGKVRVVHRPAPPVGQENAAPPQTARLLAERLEADLTSTGGLGAWVDGDSEAAEIEAITAQGDVSLDHEQRSAAADFLKYVHADRTAELWALPTGRVRVREVGRPTDLFFQRIIWDLENNTVLAKDASGVVAPIDP